ncbi:LEAF RUST 10 DISEASE-RESISTANCE LOCUS RECEPTOR-LIKE PROTEIN KINASE-like 2.1 [Prosopis cineraria]|uniref:LEAF RUST 10 DISEASE-RESISTANCE LOCUS RECEPTOR-LIKE PROTEIN KINASE-like 2.1 n=1 Tax=Prosopis cineraria TaxID=364024 RepID=UPI00240FF3B5|nr:LEAF RUST 10 DISEASE-RESISTANCE LOCUS RECEPTOR-LIKE PROTEIN KINASE-like 2.1 [Prosopis cineraria]
MFIRMVSVKVFCFLLPSFILQLFLVGAEKCPLSVNCGNLGEEIHFPFTSSDHPDCGLLIILGCGDNDPNTKKTIKYNEKWFDVVELNQTSFTIRDDDLHDFLLSHSCNVFNHSLPFSSNSSFASYSLKYKVNLFNCKNNTVNLDPPESYSMFNSCSEEIIFYKNSSSDDDEGRSFFKSCKTLQLPISNTTAIVKPDFQDKSPFDFLSGEITIDIDLSPDCSSCYYIEGGQCRQDLKGRFYCAKEKTRKDRRVVIAVSVSGALGILLVLGFFLRRRFYNKPNPTHLLIEKFLEEHGHLTAKRYNYMEVKKATNSFRNKLGQGGFGSVYKGKLSDGTLVAVKVLTELNGDGEEFINEVSSISVTSHVNIVSLLGFCLEGSKRALIYEYMSNGSIDKYIHEQKDPSKLNLQLTCKAMYNIAVGVARGLEYLHRGCNTRILHLDIKPHNILLDDDFCPKISDFGLAKICPKKDSIVSLLGARGTAGYIAPEVFSRNFGGVSHKSDVYSYGMMMLEIVGGRKNMNMEVEGSSEIFMPHWMHQRLKANQELRLQCIKNEKDREVMKKIVIVSLWCIQIDPLNRPAMNKVVDMMEGDLESLELPQLPVLSLPPTTLSRSVVNDIISSSFHSISLSS